ncbi:related to hydrolase of the alpha/beta superfamily [Cephalotrichum gorgonifer]|uniref:Related to hydrolase of the alpha/beta superfamily n=1 Tax=Cephalotrichum gorgonifer TaxID=2041049 RepID=A0AAE8N2P1_9PEZI|nr:related to hydrolase of the alpha/beta superfamily [Cephalotrichum gorgonifer]
MAALANWSFAPLPPFAPTIFPNIQLWNVSDGLGLEYQVEVSWPFEWTSQEAEVSALAMYVLDGNALGMTAAEALKRRGPVEFAQPDTVVVAIGYPLTDTVYSPQRNIDFRPPLPKGSEPNPDDPPSGAEDFIVFLEDVLRPFVRDTLFPNVNFTRDALYGHSFGGLFSIYALLTRPDLFDTFITASPAIFWNNGSILDEVGRLQKIDTSGEKSKPAFAIGYGSLEQFPIKRRTETQEDFEFRKSIIETFKMTDNCNELYKRILGNPKLRDVVLKEYEGQDHFGVGASALTDGIDYFLDW